MKKQQPQLVLLVVLVVANARVSICVRGCWRTNKHRHHVSLFSQHYNKCSIINPFAFQSRTCGSIPHVRSKMKAFFVLFLLKALIILFLLVPPTPVEQKAASTSTYAGCCTCTTKPAQAGDNASSGSTTPALAAFDLGAYTDTPGCTTDVDATAAKATGCTTAAILYVVQLTILIYIYSYSHFSLLTVIYNIYNII